MLPNDTPAEEAHEEPDNNNDDDDNTQSDPNPIKSSVSVTSSDISDDNKDEDHRSSAAVSEAGTSTRKSHSTDTVERASAISDTTRAMPDFGTGDVLCKRWKILGELGRGGCGIVYKVERVSCSEDDVPECPTGTIAAMKAESVDPKYDETLKAEAAVLRRMTWSVHFCRLYMAGSFGADVNLVIMSVVGKSLSFLRKNCPDQRFSLSTSTRLAVQCFDAIAELHSVGYLHRDIKASNFAMGAGPDNCHIVHLLDFGFARSYLTFLNSQISHRKPRSKAPFMGTDRYCSLNVHCRIEQSRRDDLWSFLYMLIEMIIGTLPWRKAAPEELPFMKVKAIKRLVSKCPRSLKTILRHLEDLQYESAPNYKLLRRALLDIVEKNRFGWRDPYDWEEGGMFHSHFSESSRDNTSSAASPSTDSSEPDMTESSMSGTTPSESVVTNIGDSETTRWDTSWDELDSEICSKNSEDSYNIPNNENLRKTVQSITEKIKNIFAD